MGLLSSRRLSGLLFLPFVFALFFNLGLHAGTPRSFRSMYDSARSLKPSVHPITRLMDDAESAYRKKLASQSQSLSAAVSEYKRRHNRPPPSGFDDWFRFAMENSVVMIDEYDSIATDLEPFWNMSGPELRRRASQAGSLPHVDLVRIRNGKLSMVHIANGQEISQVSGRAAGFKSMLEPFAHKLPDLDFPVNSQAENRVLVPWEVTEKPELTLQDSSEGLEAMLDRPFKFTFEGEGNIWEHWRRTCNPSQNARQLYSSLRDPFSPEGKDYLSSVHKSQAQFTDTTEASFDFCDMPHAHYLQGHFFTDIRPLRKLYPIFSPAKAKGFSDIRIPSHYYYGSTKRYTYGWDSVNLELKEVDNMEIPWDQKSDKIFFRGNSLGGGSTPPGFSPQYHRHRFVHMASETSLDHNRSIVFENPSGSGQYSAATVPVGKLNEEMMDVAFVLFADSHNYPGGKEAMAKELRLASSVPLSRHWAFKYNVDLDGLGYSGRFMAMLASDSVPMKASIYEEFYSGWIQPWLHFIPLSQTYHEIYNIHSYFSGPTPSTLQAANSPDLTSSSEESKPKQNDAEKHPNQNDARLRRMARAGKKWHELMARKVDLQAYVYRLCLEYARLFADDREASSYSPSN